MKRVRTVLIFILFIFYPTYIFADTQYLRIHFLDVQEGDSVFIETDKGRTALIDTGNLITGFRVAEYLKENNVGALDHLIFTHPDLDHIGGAFFILQMLKVENLYDNGQDLTEAVKSSDIYRWYEELVRKGKNYKTLKEKDTILLGDITLKIIWPPQPSPFFDYNTNSLVIMLEYGQFRCLLAGDLTTLGERRILEEEIELTADVLKVGHHGANDATCQEFLSAVLPQIAIISVNKANIRGYPAGEVVERLKKAGIQLYRTDEDGDILLTIYQPRDKEFKIEVNNVTRENYERKLLQK